MSEAVPQRRRAQRLSAGGGLPCGVQRRWQPTSVLIVTFATLTVLLWESCSGGLGRRNLALKGPWKNLDWHWGNNGRKGYGSVKWPHLLEKFRRANMVGGFPMFMPRDGVKMFPDGNNSAIKNANALAINPLEFRLDRFGRVIKDSEKTIPTGTVDYYGDLPSAAAPLGMEEFEGRWKRLDPLVRPDFNTDALQDRNIAKILKDHKGKDEYRTIRTFTLPGENGAPPSSIQIIAASRVHDRSRQLAARAVYEVQPTALVVQLCKERIGRYLVMPKEHLHTVASFMTGWNLGNPERNRNHLKGMTLWVSDIVAVDQWMSDLAYQAAVDEFAQLPKLPEGSKVQSRMLCLGDTRASRLEALRQRLGNETMKQDKALSARGKQLTRSLVAAARMGHEVILGIVDVELLPHVTTWLERAGASIQSVADTSDVELGRVSLKEDSANALNPPLGQATMAKTRNGVPVGTVALNWGKTSLGAFLNEEAVQAITKRKDRLKKFTRVQDLNRIIDEPKKEWVNVLPMTRAALRDDLHKFRKQLPPPRYMLSAREQFDKRVHGKPEVQEFQTLSWERDKKRGHLDSRPPGPVGTLEKAKGYLHCDGTLEIPDHYLRDAGMEAYGPNFWASLVERGMAVETNEMRDLQWWSGSTEAEETEYAHAGWYDSSWDA